jgi:hypothetical protein
MIMGFHIPRLAVVVLLLLCAPHVAKSSQLKVESDKLHAASGFDTSFTRAEKIALAKSLVQMVRESISTEPRNVLSFARDIPRYLINEGLNKEALELVMEFRDLPAWKQDDAINWYFQSAPWVLETLLQLDERAQFNVTALRYRESLLVVHNRALPLAAKERIERNAQSAISRFPDFLLQAGLLAEALNSYRETITLLQGLGLLKRELQQYILIKIAETQILLKQFEDAKASLGAALQIGEGQEGNSSSRLIVGASAEYFRQRINP